MGIEEVHQKTPDLSFKEKMQAKTEKVLHGKEVDDAKLHDIKIRANKLEGIRDQLIEVSHAMKKWNKSGHKMAKATGGLATDMPANKGEYAGLSTDMKDDLLDSEGTRDAIKKKIKVIDDMLKDSKVLDDLLYLKARRERKTDNAGDQAQRARRSALARCADNEYATLYEELMGALRSVVDNEESEGGVAALVAPELNNFKKLQESFFTDAEGHVQHMREPGTDTAQRVFKQDQRGAELEGQTDAFHMDDIKKKLAEAEGRNAALEAQQEHPVTDHRQLGATDAAARGGAVGQGPVDGQQRGETDMSEFRKVEDHEAHNAHPVTDNSLAQDRRKVDEHQRGF